MERSYALFAHGGSGLGPDAFAPDAIAVGVAVRAAEALLAAAPYLLAGAIVAAVMRGMVGGASLRHAFSGRWGPLRAAALGLVLPLCALGVLPVARELRRAGVARGAVVAFVLAAAALNPLSLAYGLTLVGPALLAGIVLATLAVSLGVGRLLGRSENEAEEAAPLELLPNTGGRRLALTALAFTQAWLGAPALCLLVGVATAGLVAGTLPPGLLASSMTRTNPWAPAAMSLVAALTYVPPLTGMMQAGTLMQDGFSSGAAWAALSLGAGVSLGGVAWVWSAYGRSAALRLVAATLSANLLVGYAAHALVPSAVTAPDHTHALDGYTRPPAGALAPLRAKLAGADALPLAALVGSALLGAALRRCGVAVGAGPTPAPEHPSGSSKWNPTVPARWVARIGSVGGALIAAQLLYVLYPPPADLFEEMTVVRTELTGPMGPADRDANIDHVRRYQELARKLPVAAVIRHGELTPDQRARTDELVESLEALRESLEGGRQAEAVALLRYVKDTAAACRAAYLTGPTHHKGTRP